MRIRISDKRFIGDGYAVFVIAEIGNNHQGQMSNALKAIKLAADAGADAVTLQYAPLHTICTKDMYKHPNVAFLSECEFSIDQLRELVGYARRLGMAFSINVEDMQTLDQILEIGIDFIKLCSADLTNFPYIQYCASKGLPVFFSTGAAYVSEIEQAYKAMIEGGLTDYVIYHTNSGYPTKIEDANIVQMDMLHEKFGGVKGYCDHTCEIVPPVVAVSRGAKVIEKHITTDRKLKGDDWMVSLEPDQFKLMVTYIRQAEDSLGTREKIPLESEQPTRHFKRKSIVSRVGIKKGVKLTMEHLCYKLPGTGIAPCDLDNIIGRKTVIDIPEDTVILPRMLGIG